MVESREVCKICYASTSHKANPTLTPESKATYDPVQKKRKCTICRQEWAPIRVAKEFSTGKWVRIRIRPKIPSNIDYQLCKNFQSRVECPKGQECSFAHSKAELAIWNSERQNEPRPAPPINGPYQYQLCKHMLNTGNCPYGQRCTFAHTEEERKHWLRHQTGAEGNMAAVTNGGFITGVGYTPPQPVVMISAGAGVGLDYRCDVCGLSCTSKKQLEDHFAGSRHRQMSTKSIPTQFVHPIQQQPPRIGIPGGHFRRRPTLAFPINGYKMCLHIQAGRRCVYEDFCTFAHSQHELDEWNSQLQHTSRARTTPQIARFQNMAYGSLSTERLPGSYATLPDDTGAPPSVNTMSGLDDFEEDDLTGNGQDFGSVVRLRLMEEHNEKNNVVGFETTVENVSISEVSGRDLSLLWSQATAIDWVFEVSTTTPRVLHSVTLFDSFSSDFNITGASLITYNGPQKLHVVTKSEKGVGILFNQKISQHDKVQIKVTLIPRSGLLGQLVLFDFGSFMMVRGLVVHVLTEQESKMLDTTALARKNKPQKTDVYWEQRHKVVHIDTQYLEETDKALGEYVLPEQVEKFIESGKYKNVEIRVTKDNYRRRMHNLLYLEEYKQREDMSRYDLYDIEITPHKDYKTPSGVNFALGGYYFVKVTLEETVFEGGRTIRMGDGALLLPSNHRMVYECNVEHVGRESVILKITEGAKQACASNGNRCSVRFVLSRIQMRSMHYAVDKLDLSTIFPEPSDGNGSTDRSTSVLECVKELKTSELYQSQQDAIMSMLDPACTKVPSLVLGPFGCGKTRTLSECIQLLATMVSESCILICTHSNSAANLYVEGIDKVWRERYNAKAPMFRLYYTGRLLSTITPTVKQYCRFNMNGQLALPPVADLQQYKIVVATLMTARALPLADLPRGHFTHIFIDEAAQALESESIIPLCLANGQTKIILAGDHMQLDPPVHSHIARKYGLHVSLLERLYDHEAYNSGVGLLCKTLLTENHRSHQQILELPSKLFYKNKLTCRAVFPQTGPKDFPAIKFVGVSGQECQAEDSPSFYNDHEVIKVVEQVQLLIKGGLAETEICALAYYRSQVFKMRHMLRQKRLGQVQVHRVDDVQGKEFRALLLSTVRTCSTEPPIEEEAGFLTNPKLFNTAVTRAKEWLIVVGEPFTLCTVGENRLCWMEYIRCCQQLGSFDYTNADQFVEESLDYKIVARQLLEKAHESFFRRMHSNAPPSQDHSKAPPTSTPSHTTPVVTYMQAGAQQQQEMLRSKVTVASQNGDESTIRRITDELLKMTLDQQAYLISKPELLSDRVREMEQVFRRAGPTAAILNTNRMEAPLLTHPAPPRAQGGHAPFTPQQGSGFNGVPQHGAVGSNVAQNVPSSNGGIAALTGDLPPYLRNAMESVMMYAKWVDRMLQTPLSSSEVRENMLKQQANVNQQLKLINEQIFLYREMLKLLQYNRPTQPQIPRPPHQGALPPSTVTIGMGAGKFTMPTAGLGNSNSNPVGMFSPPPQQQPPMSQSQQHYQLFSHHHSGPGPMRQAFSQPGMGAARGIPEDHGNSAFSYGVSAIFPNTLDHTHPPLSVQTNPVPGLVTGGRGLNAVSPLDAAISASSNRSTPSHSNHKNDQELYISDDELFN